MDFTSEYNKIILFRQFRESIVRYFISFISEVLRKNRVVYDLRKMTRFVEASFVRWWFFTASQDCLDSFVPSKFEVLVEDLFYYFRRNGITSQEYFYDSKVVTEAELKFRRGLLRKSYPCSATIIPLGSKYLSSCLIYNHNSVVETMTISNRQLQGLRERFRGRDDPLPYITICLGRLLALGSINEHMSIPPALLELLKIDLELFGTPLNTSLSRYCSPFPDIDKYFSSEGNFFDYPLESNNRYLFNPPYDDKLMLLAVEHLLKRLASVSSVSVFCVLPVWDKPTQELLGLASTGEPYPAYEKLLTSSYIREMRPLPRELCPFYNYFSDSYSPITAVHLILLSTEPSLPTSWRIDNICLWWLQIVQ